MLRLPAEWERQSFVQFTFPHYESDWAATLPIVISCFVEIISTLAKYEQVLVVCNDIKDVNRHFQDTSNIFLTEIASNDTWARDHGGITIYKNNQAVVLDFMFTGWGLKFPANLDNQITKKLFQSKKIAASAIEVMDIALEGGGIESDGEGTILTTSECLLSPNRNPHLDRKATEAKLMSHFGAKQVLWLDHGYLAGDDTDSHIDTLARLCSKNTIAYVQCTDPEDEHFEALHAMEQQLMTFKTLEGDPYQLVALPMPDACYGTGGERLPATYANFLIANQVVLVPTYDVKQDTQALEIIKSLFPSRKIVGINCLPLIEQHGSLHCITMQYPEGVSLLF